MCVCQLKHLLKCGINGKSHAFSTGDHIPREDKQNFTGDLLADSYCDGNDGIRLMCVQGRNRLFKRASIFRQAFRHHWKGCYCFSQEWQSYCSLVKAEARKKHQQLVLTSIAFGDIAPHPIRQVTSKWSAESQSDVWLKAVTFMPSVTSCVSLWWLGLDDSQTACLSRNTNFIRPRYTFPGFNWAFSYQLGPVNTGKVPTFTVDIWQAWAQTIRFSNS